MNLHLSLRLRLRPITDDTSMVDPWGELKSLITTHRKNIRCSELWSWTSKGKTNCIVITNCNFVNTKYVTNKYNTSITVKSPLTPYSAYSIDYIDYIENNGKIRATYCTTN